MAEVPRCPGCRSRVEFLTGELVVADAVDEVSNRLVRNRQAKLLGFLMEHNRIEGRLPGLGELGRPLAFYSAPPFFLASANTWFRKALIMWRLCRRFSTSPR